MSECVSCQHPDSDHIGPAGHCAHRGCPCRQGVEFAGPPLSVNELVVAIGGAMVPAVVTGFTATKVPGSPHPKWTISLSAVVTLEP